MFLVAMILTVVWQVMPHPGKYPVEIDGRKYEVIVKPSSDVVKVSQKSFITKRSPELGERLRRAVKAATRCEIENWYWEDAHIEGQLNCASKYRG